MPSYGARSRAALETAHPDLQTIGWKVIEVVDHSVIWGHRNEAQQNALFPKYSQVTWPDSMHNALPSNAIDVVPWVPGIGAITGSPKQISEFVLKYDISRARVEADLWWQYGVLWGAFVSVAFDLGISIRSGADWDSDGSTLDTRFVDAGHIELV